MAKDGAKRPTTKRPSLGAPPRRQREARTSAFEGERVAKIMARAGLCSRRDAEAWIAAGRVAINGRPIADPAVNVTEQDVVTADGAPLARPDRTRLFLFNKPRGLVTTERDPQERPTVFGYVAHHHPHLPRLVSVGRLDINTEGLLLLTNDGGLARALELPSTGWVRRYRVRARGEPNPQALAALKDGVTIDGVDYAPIEATLDRTQGANVWLTMALREGKNREVRRVLDHLGLEVNRLIRVSYGPFQLGDAPEGAAEEVRARVLMDQLGPALIEESGADFSATPEERRARRREERAQDAPPPRREKPQAGKRKHVSTLRAERQESRAEGERVRVTREATQDRRGREVAVERVAPAKPRPPADAPDTRNARRFRDERQAASPRPPGKGPRPMGPRARRDDRDEARPPRSRDAAGPGRGPRGRSEEARGRSEARGRGDAPKGRGFKGSGPKGFVPRGDAPARPPRGEGVSRNPSRGSRPPRDGAPKGRPPRGRP